MLVVVVEQHGNLALVFLVVMVVVAQVLEHQLVLLQAQPTLEEAAAAENFQH